MKIKGKYANVVCEIAGTGYRFNSAAIETIKSLQAEQKDRADADSCHKSYVRTDIGPHGTYIQTTTLFPEDAKAHADDLAAIATDPANWR